ncbi:AAA family ATPase [Nanoarchaeota archaeon]
MRLKAKVFGIISIKGGVGKTAVSANLGVALSQFKKKTLIVDADFSSPNLAMCFGILKPIKTINQVFKGKITPFEAIHEYTENLDLLPSAMMSDKLDPYLLKEKIKILRDHYDYIIIDSSPTLNDEMLATILASDEIFVVTSPDYPTLSATLHATKVAKKENTAITGLILNRVRKKNFELTVEDIEEASSVPIVAVLQEDLTVPMSVAHTTPSTMLKPTAKTSVEFMKLGASIVNEEYQDPRFLAKIRNLFMNEVKKEEINRQLLRNN